MSTVSWAWLAQLSQVWWQVKSYEEQQAEEEAARREEEAACERLRRQLMQVRGTDMQQLILKQVGLCIQSWRMFPWQRRLLTPGCSPPSAPATVPGVGGLSHGAPCVEIMCKPCAFHGPEHCQSKRS